MTSWRTSRSCAKGLRRGVGGALAGPKHRQLAVLILCRCAAESNSAEPLCEGPPRHPRLPPLPLPGENSAIWGLSHAWVCGFAGLDLGFCSLLRRWCSWGCGWRRACCGLPSRRRSSATSGCRRSERRQPRWRRQGPDLTAAMRGPLPLGIPGRLVKSASTASGAQSSVGANSSPPLPRRRQHHHPLPKLQQRPRLRQRPKLPHQPFQPPLPTTDRRSSRRIESGGRVPLPAACTFSAVQSRPAEQAPPKKLSGEWHPTSTPHRL